MGEARTLEVDKHSAPIVLEGCRPQRLTRFRHVPHHVLRCPEAIPEWSGRIPGILIGLGPQPISTPNFTPNMAHPPSKSTPNLLQISSKNHLLAKRRCLHDVWNSVGVTFNVDGQIEANI